MVGIGLGLLVGSLIWGRTSSASGSTAQAGQTGAEDGPGTGGQPYAGDGSDAAGGYEVSAGSTDTPLASLDPEEASARAAALKANEMGLIPVLEYHCIQDDVPEDDLHRSTANFRADIERLKQAGFYPINVRDMAAGRIDVPAGKSPVVLTFDDSSPGQFRLLDDGTIDPDCAVGIMQAAVEDGDWAPRASFFPLLYVDPEDYILWGQKGREEEKLTTLVSLGYEIGSHTRTHADLKAAPLEACYEELGRSQFMLEDMIGSGYRVTTLSVPFGSYPANESILVRGSYEGRTYRYEAALEAFGGPNPSPFAGRFDPTHIKRIPVYGNALDEMLSYFERHLEDRFISDGDPSFISIPQQLPESLGALGETYGLPVITY